MFPDAVIVLVHHEGRAHLTENLEDLEKAFRILGISTRLLPLRPGRTVQVPLEK